MSILPYDGWHDNDAWAYAQTRRKRDAQARDRKRERKECDAPGCQHSSHFAVKLEDGTINDLCMAHFLEVGEKARCED